MSSRINNISYRDTPFSDTQFTCCPNYAYSSVVDLANLKVSESFLREVAWCRTVGVLNSFHGQFYVSDMNCTGGIDLDIKIQISLVYLKSPQSKKMLQSIVMPCPVQIFGLINWLGKKPVVFVKLIQVLTVPRALQMKDIMDQLIVLKSHGLAKVTS